MIERARRGFTAPSTRTLGPGPELEAVSRGVGQIGAQARGYAAQKFDQAQRIKAEEEQEAARRIREREIADDNAAFINAEIEFNERVAELRSTLQGEVGPDGDGYAKKLKEQAEKLQGKAIEGLPSYVTEEGRQRVSLRLAQLTASERMNATQWQDARAKEYAVTTYTRSLNAAATSVIENPDNAQSVLQAQKAYIDGLAGRLSAPERDALWRQTEQQMLVASIDGLNQRGDFAQARELIEATAGVTSAEDQRTLSTRIERAESEADRERAEALALSVQLGETDARQLKELHSSGVIGDAEYGARLAQVERMEAAREAEYQARVSQQMTANAQALELGILDGKAGRADIDLALEQGLIDSKTHLRLAKQAATAENTSNKYQEAMNAFANGQPVNPYDSDMKNAMDYMFEQSGGVELFSDPASTSQVLGQMADMGVLAPKAVSSLQGMRLNGDPEQKQFAFQSIYDLSQRNSTLTDAAFDDNTMREAIDYGEQVTAGITPDRALEAIEIEREARRQRKGSPDQVLIDEARKISSEKGIGHVKGLLPGIFGGDLAGDFRAEGAMLQDYQRAFQNEYILNGGDEKKAKTFARHKLKQIWGRSEVNGGAIMAYAPEKNRGFENIRPKYMREMLVNHTKEEMGPAVFSEQRMKDVELVADPMTAREAQAGELPSYSVMVTLENGTVTFLPQRYQFDLRALQEKMRQEKRDKVQSARAKKAAQFGSGSQLDELKLGYR